jgi:hypothetical protein
MQPLAYEWHVNESKDAHAQWKQLWTERQRLAEEQEALTATLVVLEQRKVAAQAAAGLADADQHCVRARAILEELEPLGPLLDRVIEHPTEGQIFPGDPPLACKTAALAGALVTELRALKITDAKFPAHYRWDVASKHDLAKELQSCPIRATRYLSASGVTSRLI